MTILRCVRCFRETTTTKRHTNWKTRRRNRRFMRMKPWVTAALFILISASFCLAEPPDDNYPAGPDSKPQAGVAPGKLFNFGFDQSKIFPGTHRGVGVYVPAAYKADKPACVYVGLDGLGFNAPTVFDNLIARKEMPITIGVGLIPGQVEPAEGHDNPRFNRSLEFDGMNDSLARFVLEELLPAVEAHKTPDGLPILLSKDGNDRCAGGASTGGIGAFTLAWQRPDAFRRVFTAIGTFVGMRGGDQYPVLVRKTEPKGFRIFMQDGSNDEWWGGPEVGDWWMGNQTMVRALEFSGYDIQHVFGHGTHNGNQATQVFPDAMRFLWKDWPQPTKSAGNTQNQFLGAILEPEQSWQRSGKRVEAASEIASDPGGKVHFRDGATAHVYSVSQDAEPLDDATPGHPNAVECMEFGPDGRLYEQNVQDPNQIVAVDESHKRAVIARGFRPTTMTVLHDRSIYAAGFDNVGWGIWFIKTGEEPRRVDFGLNNPSGIAISPDYQWLAVVERTSHWGYSYRVQPDGTLTDRQRFYWLHVPDSADDSGANALAFDRDGRLYAATRMGVQVCDRNGRSRAILPLPENGEATSLCFGGKDFDTLFVTAGGKVYSRKLRSRGAPAWEAPIKLPGWGAG